MSNTETVDYTSDIEITEKRPLHPREYLKRKFKQKSDKIKFLKKSPQQSRNRLKRKIKSRKKHTKCIFNKRRSKLH